MGPKQEDPIGQRTHDVDDTLKYSSSLQSSGFLRLRSRQTAEPSISVLFSRTASHPVGHFSHSVLGSFSCGWNHALGQLEHSFEPFDDAYFPFAQFMHETEPPKLVCPRGHKSHADLSWFPFVPARQACVSLQTPSAEQFVASQPSAMVTEDTPPTETVPASGL